jgi:hypothetical protein
MVPGVIEKTDSKAIRSTHIFDTIISMDVIEYPIPLMEPPYTSINEYSQ